MTSTMSFIKTYTPQKIFEPGFFEDLSEKISATTDVAKALEVETLLIHLFDIKKIYEKIQKEIRDQHILSTFRKRILQKTIIHTYTPKDIHFLTHYNFLDFIRLDDTTLAALALEDLTPRLALYCAWRLWSPLMPDRGMFYVPEKPKASYPFNVPLTPRADFELCDHALTNNQAYLEATYCLHCHKNNKDTCRTGLIEKPGCPVDLPISEMNQLYAMGHPLAALVLMMNKNPMILATGHRICADCMDSCIFQTQDPVNVPGIESNITHLCLHLPWGFEILYLLSYWNPLNPHVVSLKKSVLVVGMGPGGFTLAHQLLARGHTVVGMDGLELTTPKAFLTRPLKNFNVLHEPLSTRHPKGFGGVMEYGITARWNKNYLTAIMLMLARHPQFTFMGHHFFGDTFGLKQAFSHGFDHVALALGAGRPHIPLVKNTLVPGVWLASDFLMALHTSFKKNLKLYSPIVVIGGGLTAMDAATEALAYLRYHHQDPHVTVVYHRSFHHAASLQQNAHEVKEALKQGIHIREGQSKEFLVDDKGWVYGIRCLDLQGHSFVIPAKTVIIATGTQPHHRVEDILKEAVQYGGKVSMVGDMDPAFKGSVVKAIASSMKAAPLIHKALNKAPCSLKKSSLTLSFLKKETTATLLDAKKIAPDMYELYIHAPFASRMFKPGHFFKVSLPSLKPMALSGIGVKKDVLTFVIGGQSPTALALRDFRGIVTMMGPTGTPFFIPKKKKVLLMGEGLGNAILVPALNAMKQAKCHVDYVAYGTMVYEKALRTADTFQTSLESSFEPYGPWDYGLFIGSSTFTEHHAKVMKNRIRTLHVSLHASFMCMMQGVCGRCLQKDKQGTWIFACHHHHLNEEHVDFDFMNQRLRHYRSI